MSTYRFTGKIGEGGMAEVFSAIQEGLERPVAIKVLKQWMASDPTLVQRLRNEAQTLAAMHHDGIVKVIDLGDLDGRPFLVMEMLQGQTLQQRLRPQRDVPAMPLSEQQTIAITEQVLDVLAYAHERHVVHRDIKPGNVFLCDETQGHKIKLMDFGIASLLTEPRMTRAGDQLGTPEYMCPEQIEGKSPTPQWDIYGMGILMYEMASGDVPFNADTPIAVAHKHLHERVPQLPAHLSPRFRTIVEKALAKDPAQRFVSSREMLAALRSEIPVTPPEVFAAPMPAVEQVPFAAPMGSAPAGSVPMSGAAPALPAGAVATSAASPDAARPLMRRPLAMAGGGIGIVILIALIAILGRSQVSPSDSVSNAMPPPVGQAIFKASTTPAATGAPSGTVTTDAGASVSPAVNLPPPPTPSGTGKDVSAGDLRPTAGTPASKTVARPAKPTLSPVKRTTRPVSPSTREQRVSFTHPSLKRHKNSSGHHNNANGNKPSSHHTSSQRLTEEQKLRNKIHGDGKTSSD